MSDKNSDIEVIGLEDLEEETPPPQERTEEEAGIEASSTEEVTGETEESNATPAASKPDDDDDPPLDILTAPETNSEPASEPVLEPTSEPTLEPVLEPASEPIPAPNPVLEDLLGPARPVVTAARPVATLQEVTDDEEEDDDDIDETIAERLLGLTEMFPDFMTRGTVGLVKGSLGFTQSCYAMGRTASWIVFSSAALLFMPIMIETERLQLQDQQKAQKNQMLLGPGTASSGGPSIGPPPI